MAGWDVTGNFPYGHIPRAILAVAPHTSNWDFIIGVAYRSYYKMKNARFLGKAELFKPPFGGFFRWMGGIPVNRDHKSNLVDQVVSAIAAEPRFLLAIAPEGTRKKVSSLKTGFYFIAAKAGIPIILVGFDYENKCVRFSELMYPGTNQDEDFAKIYQFFSSIRGKNRMNDLSHLR